MIYHLNDLPLGYFNKYECRYLATFASQIPDFGTIVEVGSFLGKTSVILGRHAKNTVRIFCIDIFPEKFEINVDLSDYEFNDQCPSFKQEYNILEQFKNNTKTFSNIVPIVGNSPYEVKSFNESIDMFFLDASHKNPNDLDNLNFFCPMVKSGGIICGHDFSNNFPDVQKNVKMLEKLYNKKAIIFPKGSFWMLRKP